MRPLLSPPFLQLTIKDAAPRGLWWERSSNNNPNWYAQWEPIICRNKVAEVVCVRNARREVSTSGRRRQKAAFFILDDLHWNLCRKVNYADEVVGGPQPISRHPPENENTYTFVPYTFYHSKMKNGNLGTNLEYVLNFYIEKIMIALIFSFCTFCWMGVWGVGYERFVVN